MTRRPSSKRCASSGDVTQSDSIDSWLEGAAIADLRRNAGAMPLNAFLERARRASRRSPRYIANRLVEMAAGRVRRPWSSISPYPVPAASVAAAAGAPSIDAFWEARQRDPFFIASARREDT